MKVRVYVALRHGVHDPQGEAIERALSQLGMREITSVKACKFFDLEIEGTKEQAHRTAAAAAEKLLANTVIEKFWVEDPSE